MQSKKRNVTRTVLAITVPVAACLALWYLWQCSVRSEVEGLSKPNLFARYRGTASHPDGNYTVHIYTYDPGATGVAHMWLYYEVSSNTYVQVFDGDIPDGSWLVLAWPGEHTLEVEHLDRFRNLTKTVINCDSIGSNR